MFRFSKEECQAPWRSWGAFRNKIWLQPRGRGHQLSSALGTEDRGQDRRCMGTHGCAVPRAPTAWGPHEAAAVGSAAQHPPGLGRPAFPLIGLLLPLN